MYKQEIELTLSGSVEDIHAIHDSSLLQAGLTKMIVGVADTYLILEQDSLYGSGSSDTFDIKMLAFTVTAVSKEPLNLMWLAAEYKKSFLGRRNIELVDIEFSGTTNNQLVDAESQGVTKKRNDNSSLYEFSLMFDMSGLSKKRERDLFSALSCFGRTLKHSTENDKVLCSIYGSRPKMSLSGLVEEIRQISSNAFWVVGKNPTIKHPF